MANHIRSAKSGSKWTHTDLDSYHISINWTDPLAFFGLQELPQPSVDEELLVTTGSLVTDASLMQQDHHAELITLLRPALIPSSKKNEAPVDDFTVELFKVLGYVCRQRVACTRVDISYRICGKLRCATADICIVDYSHGINILLLVQKEKRLERMDPFGTQAQLVAKAIAAFRRNNNERELYSLPPLTEKVMPGIVMHGTWPIFFKIPVTQALVDHVSQGTYPPEETHVTYCYPSCPRSTYRSAEGMRPLDNRHEIFRCYEAFKSIVGI